MTVLVDPPRWPAHGRLWSHLVSDTSLAELHAVAGAAGVPRRGFSGDHYDVPAEMLDAVVAAGAVPVPARELLRALQASGLRVPKRRGETVLASWESGALADLAGTAGGDSRVDLLASTLPVPRDATSHAWLVAVDAAGDVLLVEDSRRGRRVPGGVRDTAETGAEAAVRATAEATGVVVGAAEPRPAGYLRWRATDRPDGLAGRTDPACRTGPSAPPAWRFSVYYAVRLPRRPVGADAHSSSWVPPGEVSSALRGPGASARDALPLVAHVLGLQTAP